MLPAVTRLLVSTRWSNISIMYVNMFYTFHNKKQSCCYETSTCSITWKLSLTSNCGLSFPVLFNRNLAAYWQCWACREHHKYKQQLCELAMSLYQLQLLWSFSSDHNIIYVLLELTQETLMFCFVLFTANSTYNNIMVKSFPIQIFYVTFNWMLKPGYWHVSLKLHC